MPAIDNKLKTIFITIATKLLVAQSTKFQSMLLKIKDDYLVKLQEEGINQIAEKGPTIVCPIIIPEVEKILPKLNTLRGIVSNMDKLAGTINGITTKIDKPLQIVNTVIPVLELLPAPLPPFTPINVILGVNKAIDTLKKILDGLETGVNSLSTTSDIIVKYVIILDNLLQTIQTTLEQIITLCASNFNAEQEASLINNIRNALLFDPENANSTQEEDTAVDNELEEQLKNGDLTYQGFKLTLEYDPTPTTLLPSKRIIATGLADTAVEILVEGGEANIPIEGIELYYPIPLPLSEEDIQKLQSDGNFYDSSYTYSSNNTTLLTLIKNKIDNYLNGKTEDYVRYEVTFNYEQPDFRGQIQSQIDWLQNWQSQHTALDLSELIKEGQDLLGEIPDVFASLYINPQIFGNSYYGGTPIANGSVLNLPPGKHELLYEKNLDFHRKYQNFLADKKLSNSYPTITSGNSILSGSRFITSLYELNVINASTIEVIVETTGTKRGEDYYNFANFPNEGAIPFEEIPENIDTTKAPQIREYDGDKYSKGFYAWDVQEKRWELLDLKPFGYIEGIKNGDWKVKRENGENTYYEWYEGKYEDDGSIVGEVNDDGSIASNSYPHWVKKTSDDWKARIGNLWRICGNWGALYNVPQPSAGTDETCVIYYISNENDFTVDTYFPIDTLRGAIWRWNEELVRWLPQNLGTDLDYIKPTDNKYWDPEFWDNNTKKLSFQINPDDIPDDGKWPTILPSDVDNALDSFLLNGSITKSIIDPLDYKLSFLLLLLGPIGALGGPAILALIENKIENSVEDKYGKGSAEYENSKNYKYLQNPITPISFTDIPSPKRKYTNVFPPTKRYDNLSNSNFAEKQAQLAKKLFEGRR
jgi:hypothetical protein